jgi:hypothetical protein
MRVGSKALDAHRVVRDGVGVDFQQASAIDVALLQG